MEASELLEEEPVSANKKPPELAEGEPTIEIERQIELPAERICWSLTLLELYFHVGSLYALKLLLEGRIGWATTLTGKELFER